MRRGISLRVLGITIRDEGDGMDAKMETVVGGEKGSPFAYADTPSPEYLEVEGAVRYLMVSGKQDDGLWGPVGTIWISRDDLRGGFLVNPWALWEGSELVRGYRSALERGWTHPQIFSYWNGEVWPRGYIVDEERETETLMLLHELVAAL
jgi:hypothetical protein